MRLQNNMITNITEDILDKLECRCEKITYTASADLFYEGQVPVVAYLILSGNVHLMKKKKVIETLGSGTLIGAKELLHGSNVDYTAVIMPQTRVCFLSRSDIAEIMNEDSKFSEDFNQLIAV